MSVSVCVRACVSESVRERECEIRDGGGGVCASVSGGE